MKQKVNDLLADCDTQLRQLPTTPTSDPATEVARRVNEFCVDFSATIFSENRKRFVQANRERYMQFREDVLRTCPDFRPNQHTSYRNMIGLSDGDPPAGGYTGPSMGLTAIQMAITASVTFARGTSKNPRTDLTFACSSTGWELPGVVPPNAINSLIRGFTAQWRKPSLSCFADVFDNSSQLVRDLISEHFAQFKALEKHIR
jgi:hypothetical protein